MTVVTTDATLVGTVPRRAEQAEPFAPGWPGLPARWTSSAKSGIGTAVSRDSRVWFTLSHGILNEIYYPRVDHACTRDLGFIVTDGQSYFSEEKRDTRSETSQVAPGIPAYRIHNTSADGRYRIEKEILTDPWRDVVLQRVRFVPLQGTLADFHLYVLLAPHLANAGAGNTAWVGDYKGSPMLFAEREHHALALASSAPWLARSVGFVGVSDGWQELHANKRLDRTYARAENGNVAVTGEIDLVSCDGTFVMALGFGPTAMEAGQHALITLLEDFDETHAEYVRAWRAWHARLVDGVPPTATNAPVSHQCRGAADTRIEAGGGRNHRQPLHSVGIFEAGRRSGRLSPGLAAGSRRDRGRLRRHRRARARQARAALPAGDAGAGWPLVAEHVARRQAVLARRADGRNRTPDSPRRSCGARRRDRHGRTGRAAGRWCAGRPSFSRATVPSVRRTDGKNNRDTRRSRWRPRSRRSSSRPIWLTRRRTRSRPQYLRETADAWNASIERWLYVEGTELAQLHGVDGYYVASRAARPGRRRIAVSGVRPDQESSPG